MLNKVFPRSKQHKFKQILVSVNLLSSQSMSVNTVKPTQINGINTDLQKSMHTAYLHAIYNN